MRYRIVDTGIQVSANSEIEQIVGPFRDETAPIDIKTDISMYPQNFYGIDVLDVHGMQNALRNESGVLLADENWEFGRLYGNSTDELMSLAIMQLYSYLVTRDTLLIHSSLVDYNGSGIMFLGPSGIGKTTQAEKWKKYQNAEILNGDMVFVRKNKDGFYGYGSPWHGSSPYYENAKVKLKALVVLEQAQENELYRLDDFEVLHGLMDQVFLPHWQMDEMEACLNTIDELLAAVPVYHLANRADEEAVLLVKNELGI